MVWCGVASGGVERSRSSYSLIRLSGTQWTDCRCWELNNIGMARGFEYPWARRGTEVQEDKRRKPQFMTRDYLGDNLDKNQGNSIKMESQSKSEIKSGVR